MQWGQSLSHHRGILAMENGRQGSGTKTFSQSELSRGRGEARQWMDHCHRKSLVMEEGREGSGWITATERVWSWKRGGKAVRVTNILCWLVMYMICSQRNVSCSPLLKYHHSHMHISLLATFSLYPFQLEQTFSTVTSVFQQLRGNFGQMRVVDVAYLCNMRTHIPNDSNVGVRTLFRGWSHMLGWSQGCHLCCLYTAAVGGRLYLRASVANTISFPFQQRFVALDHSRRRPEYNVSISSLCVHATSSLYILAKWFPG